MNSCHVNISISLALREEAIKGYSDQELHMVHTLLVLKPLVFGSGHVYCYIRHHVKGWTVMVQGVLLILLA